MKKILFVIAAAACAALVLVDAAHAQDSWSGTDKRWHAGGSVIIGTVSSGLIRDPYGAFGLCVGIGAIKEVMDTQKRAEGGKFSMKDLTADAIGCAAGVSFGRFVARASSRGAEVVYRTEF